MDLSSFTDTELLRELSRLKTRKTGRTTRLVDKYIQELFEKRGEWILVADHYSTITATQLLIHRIQSRVMHEHHIQVLTDRDCYKRIKIDYENDEFSLHKYEIKQFEQEIERRKKKS